VSVFTVILIVHNTTGMNHVKIIAGVVLPLQEDKMSISILLTGKWQVYSYFLPYMYPA
jgi:hypothetical protein